MHPHPIEIGTKITGTRLTVDSKPERDVTPTGNRKICYWFKCDCGNRKRIRWRNLSATTVSCGCRGAETSREIAEKIRSKTRICRKCSASEIEKEFPKNRHRGNICNECLHILDRARYSKENDIERKERSIENLLKYHLQNINSRKKKIVTICLDDLLKMWDDQNGKCVLSNVEMKVKTGVPDMVSVDRIDSGFGYVKENCQLVCYSLNLAKASFSQNSFAKFMQAIKNA